MTQEEIFKKITDVIVSKLEVKAEDVKMESEFSNDLGADSLDRVELVMALEDEFEVEILDSDAEKFQKVADVVAFLEAKKNA
jgi:acyl carrier protein